ncbi:toxin glutamine deamidase domain-containing protein [Actinoplanes sp. TRM 88003]|uniref:Toxin glutamine deamidase domain-containing protein n=1 Tax=Paractinoplanes aksuensis TaxID=2939490 RepID=A0ABT1E0V5_9ACTN|nr:toxin glutamine deamidase domain-containing protein [Actinoplanes aksuensis]MCO8275486.1 toxin glutamine deamidase domain-containing protein [Actinoplanes aksuensis]
MVDIHIEDPNYQWVYDAVLYTVGEQLPKADIPQVRAMVADLINTATMVSQQVDGTAALSRRVPQVLSGNAGDAFDEYASTITRDLPTVSEITTSLAGAADGFALDTEAAQYVVLIVAFWTVLEIFKAMLTGFGAAAAPAIIAAGRKAIKETLDELRGALTTRLHALNDNITRTLTGVTVTRGVPEAGEKAARKKFSDLTTPEKFRYLGWELAKEGAQEAVEEGSQDGAAQMIQVFEGKRGNLDELQIFMSAAFGAATSAFITVYNKAGRTAIRVTAGRKISDYIFKKEHTNNFNRLTVRTLVQAIIETLGEGTTMSLIGGGGFNAGATLSSAFLTGMGVGAPLLLVEVPEKTPTGKDNNGGKNNTLTEPGADPSANAGKGAAADTEPGAGAGAGAGAGSPAAAGAEGRPTAGGTSATGDRGATGGAATDGAPQSAATNSNANPATVVDAPTSANPATSSGSGSNNSAPNGGAATGTAPAISNSGNPATTGSSLTNAAAATIGNPSATPTTAASPPAGLGAAGGTSTTGDTSSPSGVSTTGGSPAASGNAASSSTTSSSTTSSFTASSSVAAGTSAANGKISEGSGSTTTTASPATLAAAGGMSSSIDAPSSPDQSPGLSGMDIATSTPAVAAAATPSASATPSAAVSGTSAPSSGTTASGSPSATASTSTKQPVDSASANSTPAEAGLAGLAGLQSVLVPAPAATTINTATDASVTPPTTPDLVAHEVRPAQHGAGTTETGTRLPTGQAVASPPPPTDKRPEKSKTAGAGLATDHRDQLDRAKREFTRLGKQRDTDPQKTPERRDPFERAIIEARALVGRHGVRLPIVMRHGEADPRFDGSDAGWTLTAILADYLTTPGNDKAGADTLAAQLITQYQIERDTRAGLLGGMAPKPAPRVPGPRTRTPSRPDPAGRPPQHQADPPPVPTAQPQKRNPLPQPPIGRAASTPPPPVTTAASTPQPPRTRAPLPQPPATIPPPPARRPRNPLPAPSAQTASGVANPSTPASSSSRTAQAASPAPTSKLPPVPVQPAPIAPARQSPVAPSASPSGPAPQAPPSVPAQRPMPPAESEESGSRPSTRRPAVQPEQAAAGTAQPGHRRPRRPITNWTRELNDLPADEVDNYRAQARWFADQHSPNHLDPVPSEWQARRLYDEHLDELAYTYAAGFDETARHAVLQDQEQKVWLRELLQNKTIERFLENYVPEPGRATLGVVDAQRSATVGRIRLALDLYAPDSTRRGPEERLSALLLVLKQEKNDLANNLTGLELHDPLATYATYLDDTVRILEDKATEKGLRVEHGSRLDEDQQKQVADLARQLRSEKSAMLTWAPGDGGLERLFEQVQTDLDLILFPSHTPESGTRIREQLSGRLTALTRQLGTLQAKLEVVRQPAAEPVSSASRAAQADFSANESGKAAQRNRRQGRVRRLSRTITALQQTLAKPRGEGKPRLEPRKPQDDAGRRAPQQQPAPPPQPPTVTQTAPAESGREATRTGRVPADGYCQMYSTIGYNPTLIHDKLSTGNWADQDILEWLQDTARVRADLQASAELGSLGQRPADDLPFRAAEAFRQFVIDTLDQYQDNPAALPADIVKLYRLNGIVNERVPDPGHLRATMRDAGIDKVTMASQVPHGWLRERYVEKRVSDLIAQNPGIDAGAARREAESKFAVKPGDYEVSPEQYQNHVKMFNYIAPDGLDLEDAPVDNLQQMLSNHYFNDPPVTAGEFREIREALDGWSYKYYDRVGEAFLGLISFALSTPIKVENDNGKGERIEAFTFNGGRKDLSAAQHDTIRLEARHLHYAYVLSPDDPAARNPQPPHAPEKTNAQGDSADAASPLTGNPRRRPPLPPENESDHRPSAISAAGTAGMEAGRQNSRGNRYDSHERGTTATSRPLPAPTTGPANAAPPHSPPTGNPSSSELAIHSLTPPPASSSPGNPSSASATSTTSRSGSGTAQRNRRPLPTPQSSHGREGTGAPTRDDSDPSGASVNPRPAPKPHWLYDSTTFTEEPPTDPQNPRDRQNLTSTGYAPDGQIIARRDLRARQLPLPPRTDSSQGRGNTGSSGPGRPITSWLPDDEAARTAYPALSVVNSETGDSTTNCVMTAIAMDLSLAEATTFTAPADPPRPERWLANYQQSMLTTQEGEQPPLYSTTLDAVTHAMNSAEPGARGIMLARRGNTTSHAFNVYRHHNGVDFLDSQRQGLAVEPGDITEWVFIPLSAGIPAPQNAHSLHPEDLDPSDTAGTATDETPSDLHQLSRLVNPADTAGDAWDVPADKLPPSRLDDAARREVVSTGRPASLPSLSIRSESGRVERPRRTNIHREQLRQNRIHRTVDHANGSDQPDGSAQSPQSTPARRAARPSWSRPSRPGWLRLSYLKLVVQPRPEITPGASGRDAAPVGRRSGKAAWRSWSRLKMIVQPRPGAAPRPHVRVVDIVRRPPSRRRWVRWLLRHEKTTRVDVTVTTEIVDYQRDTLPNSLSHKALGRLIYLATEASHRLNPEDADREGRTSEDFAGVLLSDARRGLFPGGLAAIDSTTDPHDDQGHGWPTQSLADIEEQLRAAGPGTTAFIRRDVLGFEPHAYLLYVTADSQISYADLHDQSQVGIRPRVSLELTGGLKVRLVNQRGQIITTTAHDPAPTAAQPTGPLPWTGSWGPVLPAREQMKSELNRLETLEPERHRTLIAGAAQRNPSTTDNATTIAYVLHRHGNSAATDVANWLDSGALPSMNGPVRVPGDGYCQLYSIIGAGSENLLELTRKSPEELEELQKAAEPPEHGTAEEVEESRDLRAREARKILREYTALNDWLSDPAKVRADLDYYATTSVRDRHGLLPADTYPRKVATILLDKTLDYLESHADPGTFPAEVLLPYRVHKALDEDAPLDIDGARAEPVTMREFGELKAAAANWHESWSSNIGEAFLPLLAAALDLNIGVRGANVNASTGPTYAAPQNFGHPDNPRIEVARHADHYELLPDPAPVARPDSNTEAPLSPWTSSTGVQTFMSTAGYDSTGRIDVKPARNKRPEFKPAGPTAAESAVIESTETDGPLMRAVREDPTFKKFLGENHLAETGFSRPLQSGLAANHRNDEDQFVGLYGVLAAARDDASDNSRLTEVADAVAAISPQLASAGLMDLPFADLHDNELADLLVGSIDRLSRTPSPSAVENEAIQVLGRSLDALTQAHLPSLSEHTRIAELSHLSAALDRTSEFVEANAETGLSRLSEPIDRVRKTLPRPVALLADRAQVAPWAEPEPLVTDTPVPSQSHSFGHRTTLGRALARMRNMFHKAAVPTPATLIPAENAALDTFHRWYGKQPQRDNPEDPTNKLLNNAISIVKNSDITVTTTDNPHTNPSSNSYAVPANRDDVGDESPEARTPADETSAPADRARARLALEVPNSPRSRPAPRSHTDLARIADEVLREAADFDDCVVLLTALRDKLYPSGVRAGVTLDDSSIGTRRATEQFASRHGWPRASSWHEIEGAVRAAGPGSTGFVLFDRPLGANSSGSDLGHAVAVHNSGRTSPDAESDQLHWIDLDAQSITSTFDRPQSPEEWAERRGDLLESAIDLRALVVNGSAEVQHQSSDDVPSDSTARALTDASASRYGRSGLEAEIHSGFVSIPGQRLGYVPPQYGKVIINPSTGLSVIMDTGTFRWLDDHYEYVWPKQENGEVMSILEIVSDPMPNLLREGDQTTRRIAQNSREERHQVYQTLTRLRPGPTADLRETRETTLSAIFPPSRGWMFATLPDGSSPANWTYTPVRSPDNHLSVAPQYTIGVEIGSVHNFLSMIKNYFMEDQPPPNALQRQRWGNELLNDGLALSDSIANEIRNDPDFSLSPQEFRELRDIVLLAYTHGIGYALGIITPRNLIKNQVTALSRVNLSAVRSRALPNVQYVLHQRRDRIRNKFQGAVAEKVPDYHERYQRSVGFTLNGTVFESAPMSAAGPGVTVGAYIDAALLPTHRPIHQSEAFGRMTVLPDLDYSRPPGHRGLLPLELRRVGTVGLVSPDTAETTLEQLVNVARLATAQASYDNFSQPHYIEALRNAVPPQQWTAQHQAAAQMFLADRLLDPPTGRDSVGYLGQLAQLAEYFETATSRPGETYIFLPAATAIQLMLALYSSNSPNASHVQAALGSLTQVRARFAIYLLPRLDTASQDQRMAHAAAQSAVLVVDNLAARLRRQLSSVRPAARSHASVSYSGAPHGGSRSFWGQRPGDVGSSGPGRPITSRLADDQAARVAYPALAVVNSEASNSTTNCVLAAIALDMSLTAGETIFLAPDDDAQPERNLVNYQQSVLDTAEGDQPLLYSSTSLDAVADAMNESAPGSRGIMIARRRDAISHAFNVYRAADGVDFLDSQRRGLAVEPDDVIGWVFIPLSPGIPAPHDAAAISLDAHSTGDVNGDQSQDERADDRQQPTTEPDRRSRQAAAEKIAPYKDRTSAVLDDTAGATDAKPQSTDQTVGRGRRLSEAAPPIGINYTSDGRLTTTFQSALLHPARSSMAVAATQAHPLSADNDHDIDELVSPAAQTAINAMPPVIDHDPEPSATLTPRPTTRGFADPRNTPSVSIDYDADGRLVIDQHNRRHPMNADPTATAGRNVGVIAWLTPSSVEPSSWRFLPAALSPPTDRQLVTLVVADDVMVSVVNQAAEVHATADTRCEIQIRELSRLLHPRLRLSRSVEESDGGSTTVTGRVLPAQVWQRQVTWAEAEIALKAAEPGTTILFVWQRAHGPGHALAAHRTVSGTWWLDPTRNRPEDRVSTRAPALSSIYTRAVLIDSSSTVRSIPQNEGGRLAETLTDPPTGRTFGYMGYEVETNFQTNVPEEELREQGIKDIAVSRNVDVHLDIRNRVIIEFVSPAINVLYDETEGRNNDEVVDAIDHELRRLADKPSNRQPRLDQFYSADRGFRITEAEMAEKYRITEYDPTVDPLNDLYVQYTFGVPVESIYPFLQFVAHPENTYEPERIALLRAGLDFSDHITETFRPTSSRATPADVIRDVMGLRGFLAVVYTNVVGMALPGVVAIKNQQIFAARRARSKRSGGDEPIPDQLAKNYFLAASRFSLAAIRSMLSGPARDWLESQSADIVHYLDLHARSNTEIDLVSRYHNTTFLGLTTKLRDDRTAVTPQRLLNNALLPISARNVELDQYELFGIRSNFTISDIPPREPRMVRFELRAFGEKPRVNTSEMKTNADLISQLTRESDRATKALASPSPATSAILTFNRRRITIEERDLAQIEAIAVWLVQQHIYRQHVGGAPPFQVVIESGGNNPKTAAARERGNAVKTRLIERVRALAQAAGFPADVQFSVRAINRGNGASQSPIQDQRTSAARSARCALIWIERVNDPVVTANSSRRV